MRSLLCLSGDVAGGRLESRPRERRHRTYMHSDKPVVLGNTQRGGTISAVGNQVLFLHGACNRVPCLYALRQLYRVLQGSISCTAEHNILPCMHSWLIFCHSHG